MQIHHCVKWWVSSTDQILNFARVFCALEARHRITTREKSKDPAGREEARRLSLQYEESLRLKVSTILNMSDTARAGQPPYGWNIRQRVSKPYLHSRDKVLEASFSSPSRRGRWYVKRWTEISALRGNIPGVQ